MSNYYGYVSVDALMEFAHNHINGMIDSNDIARFPRANVKDANEQQSLQQIFGISFDRLRELAEAERETYRNSTQVTGYCPICAERAKQEQQEPKPLTMDELRAMNGKPAYIVVIDKTNIANPDDAFNGWGMVRWSWVRMWDAKRADLVHVDHDFCDNGKTWIAYATEPKGDAT